MNNQTKFILSAAAVVVAALVVAGFAFYFTDDNLEKKSQRTVSSSNCNAAPKESSDTLTVSGSVPAESSSRTSSSDSRETEATSQYSSPSFVSHHSESMINTSRNMTSASTVPSAAGEPEIEWPRIPLAFLNYAGVLPPTREVAAAIEQIQQDFVSATGAGTAFPIDPSDPGYAWRWEWARPTADEEFYTLFGGEAYSAMLNEEIHERGHL